MSRVIFVLLALTGCSMSTEAVDLRSERQVVALSDLERTALCEEMVAERGEAYRDPGAFCPDGPLGPILAPGARGCANRLLDFDETCEWTVGQERACQAAFFAEGRDLCMNVIPSECERPEACPRVPPL